MSSNMWIAIIEIITGVLLLIGLAIWFSKKSKKNPTKIAKDNLAELLESSKKHNNESPSNNLEAEN